MKLTYIISSDYLENPSKPDRHDKVTEINIQTATYAHAHRVRVHAIHH